MSTESLNLNDFLNTNDDANNIGNDDSSSELYVGVGKYKVSKIIPSEELDQKGQRRIRIVFTADNKDINSVVSKTYWIKNAPSVSANKNTPEFINAYGRAVFGKDEDFVKSTYGQWYDTNGLREAKVGEATLIKDLRVLLNLKGVDKFGLNEKAIQMLEEGDVRLLDQLTIGKKVNLLVGIKDAGDKVYSSVFPVFKPSWIEDPIEDFEQVLTKEREKEEEKGYSLLKSDETYVAKPLMLYEEVDNTQSQTSSDQVSEKESDDLPF